MKLCNQSKIKVEAPKERPIQDNESKPVHLSKAIDKVTKDMAEDKPNKCQKEGFVNDVKVFLMIFFLPFLLFLIILSMASDHGFVSPTSLSQENMYDI